MPRQIPVLSVSPSMSHCVNELIIDKYILAERNIFLKNLLVTSVERVDVGDMALLILHVS